MRRCDLAGANSVVILADGALLVGGDGGVFRVDPNTAKAKNVFAVKHQAGPLALSANAKQMLFVGDDKHVHVVPLTTRLRARMKWSATGDSVMSCSPSPDGKRVLVAGNDEGGTLKCFELGKPRAAYTIGSVRYAQTAWLDDKRFVTASIEWSAAVRVHDAANGAVLLELGDPHPRRSNAGSKPGRSIDAIAIDATGHALLGSRHGLARLALVAGAKAAWLLHDDVRSLALAGESLVIGAGDGTIRIVDPLTGKIVSRLAAVTAVHALAWSSGRLACVIDDAVAWT